MRIRVSRQRVAVSCAIVLTATLGMWGIPAWADEATTDLVADDEAITSVQPEAAEQPEALDDVEESEGLTEPQGEVEDEEVAEGESQPDGEEKAEGPAESQDEPEAEDEPKPLDAEKPEEPSDGDDTSEEGDSEDADEPAEPESVEMLRLYNKYTGEHLYTTDVVERDALVKVGWTDEGVGWVAPSSSDAPVYRLYNSYVKGGDHHYTRDKNEYEELKGKGWKQEGIGWYSAPAEEGVALYRAYNPYAATGTHHYTTDMTERVNMVADGWRYEGVAWYGVDTGAVAPEGSQSGWVESGGRRFYGNGDGTYATGWKTIDGKRYWFDAKGRMAMGPVDVDGTIYFLGSDGAMLTGWQTIAGRRYYFDPSSGALRRDGWLHLGSDYYYVDPTSGAAATGWITLNGQLYELDGNGKWIKVHSHNIQWAGQPNNYFCGPTSGYMILRNVGKWTSAYGASLSIENVASAMRTRAYGYTSFQDRWFMKGMNSWLGASVYTSVHTPSYETVRNAVMRSYQNGYATVVDTQERRGGPHVNGHNNATFFHIMVVDSYNEESDEVQIVDPGAGVLWPGGSQKFWYYSLKDFVSTYMQNEVYGDRQYIGVHYAR